MSVTDAQVDAALQELLHDRNKLGDDGCFGCGSNAHWGPTQIHSRIPFYREMLKRILEAAGQTHAPVHPSPAPSPQPTSPRRRAGIETGHESS